MYCSSLLALLLSGAAGLPPEAVVQAQLQAYNRHDVAGLAATFAADAELLELATGVTRAKGLEAVKAFYAQRFQDNPQVRAEVVQRTVQGTFIIDQERLTGLADAPADRVVTVVSEVRGGVVARAWFIR